MRNNKGIQDATLAFIAEKGGATTWECRRALPYSDCSIAYAIDNLRRSGRLDVGGVAKCGRSWSLVYVVAQQ